MSLDVYLTRTQPTEEPERFQSEAVKLLRETPESYGEAAAPYFVFILNEMRANDSSALRRIIMYGGTNGHSKTT